VIVAANDITGLVVRLRPAVTMKGRVVIESDPAKPPVQAPPRHSLALDPAGGQPWLGMPSRFQAEGATEFEIVGVLAGEYWLRVLSSGWLVKSIQWRGREYAQAPFDTTNADDLSGVVVTMTNAVPVMTGAVRAPDNTAAESGLVIVFPTQPAQRVNAGLSSPRMRSAAIESNGTYRLTTVPAGDYFVAAISRARLATWRDPDFLAQIERQATRVTLTWGQTINQDLAWAVVK
jgi:hypothetical protein